MAETPTATSLADPMVLIGYSGAAMDTFAFVPLSALTTSMTAGKTLVQFSFNVTLNASLLTGRQTVTATVNGLQTTDRIVECQPTADLPGNLTIGYAFISGANALKIAFTTPVIYTGNSSIPLLLTVLR